MKTQIKALLRKPIVKEISLMMGATLIMLFLVNVLGVDMAFAQDAITDGDRPGVITDLSGGEGSIRALVLRIVNFALGFLGFLAVLMVIYGGIMYVTSGGDQEKTEKGKKIIFAAAGGVILIIVSFALVNTLLQAGAGGASTGV